MSIKHLMVVIIVLFAGFMVATKWLTVSAYLLWPIDDKPELILSDFNDPKKIADYKNDLCAWSERDEVRHPSFISKAQRISACK